MNYINEFIKAVDDALAKDSMKEYNFGPVKLDESANSLEIGAETVSILRQKYPNRVFEDLSTERFVYFTF